MTMFDNLDQIRNVKFVGNHFNDMGTFDGIREFAEDKNQTLSDRAEALRIMLREGMGMAEFDSLSDTEVLTLSEIEV